MGSWANKIISFCLTSERGNQITVEEIADMLSLREGLCPADKLMAGILSGGSRNPESDHTDEEEYAAWKAQVATKMQETTPDQTVPDVIGYAGRFACLDDTDEFDL